MLDAERWAITQERNDVIEAMKKYADIYENLAIRNAAEVSKEVSIKEQILKDMAETKVKIMNL